jgi:hypothetical protein
VGDNDRDEVVEDDEDVEEIEEIGVAVLDIEIEAEVDNEVVGVAVVVKDVAVVVSGIDATDVEAGEVEPPNVHSDPSGIYSKESTRCNYMFKFATPTLGPK